MSKDKELKELELELAKSVEGLDGETSSKRMQSKEKLLCNLKKVKVAVIDNGFDFESLKDFEPKGESFVYQAEKEQNWFIPSDLHGTQMASFITQLNPHCELFLAKVGHSQKDLKPDAIREVRTHGFVDPN